MTREEQVLEAAGEIDDCVQRLETAYLTLREVLREYAVEAVRQAGATGEGVGRITSRLDAEIAGRLAATALKPIFYTSSAPAPVDDLSALWIERLASGKLTTTRKRPSDKWAPLAGQDPAGQGGGNRTSEQRWGR